MNLFRFAKKHEYVVNELLDTERKYIEQMKTGLDSYVKIFEENDLPSTLQGKKDILFSCLGHVLDFHENTFYSLLEQHIENIQQLLRTVSEQIIVS